MAAPRLFSTHSDGKDVTRYYSLARYALVDALRLLGIGQGHRVLLPSFLCRDLLAPITLLGAMPCWYEVEPGLTAAGSPDMWPEADAVLAVNYFGFAQDLAPFAAYAKRTGAKIIEDNAHGYLSRDTQGCWLGTRAAVGLFSLRKTLRIPDGAALLVNDTALLTGLPEQLPFDGSGLNPAQALKAGIRHIPLIGSGLLCTATILARAIRKQRTGNATPLSDPSSESKIPSSPNPWTGLAQALMHVDGDSEIARRREAYSRCALAGARCGVSPVFTALPDYCAPYGYSFRGDSAGLAAMQRLADRMGFDLVTWPDLPGAVRKRAPEYYHNVRLINFLW
ncbi:MAG: DegT/DnrJ/EryC1/StrS family aminotransferase [Nitrospira sp.]